MTDPAIILAAGASSRFDAVKQAYRLKDTALLHRAVATARRAELEPVVVLGAHRGAVEKLLSSQCPRVFNSDWEEGMASSIRRGVEYVAHHLEADRLMICTCDQPLVAPAQLRELHRRVGADVEITAAEYDGVLGVPACFSRRVFSELLELQGDRGARSLLRRNPARVESVSIPQAAFDIDTLADARDVVQRMDHGRIT